VFACLDRRVVIFAAAYARSFGPSRDFGESGDTREAKVLVLQHIVLRA
jgi:hypothetical protein